MNPMCAAVKRHAEGTAVGDAAAADMIRRLDDDITLARRSQALRRGNSGGAGANDDGVKIARGKRRGRSAPPRQRRQTGRSGAAG